MAGSGTNRRVNGRARTAPARANGSGADAVEKESTHPCFDCALCCTYLAVEIDEPTTNTEYDYIVWYLYHEGVSVFVDWEGDWYLKVDRRCQHLTGSGLCGIYDERPAICRDFSHEDCERNSGDDAPDKWLFESADQFLGWLRRRRPKSYQRFRAFQRGKKRAKGAPALRRVKVTQVALPVLQPR